MACVGKDMFMILISLWTGNWNGAVKVALSILILDFFLGCHVSPKCIFALESTFRSRVLSHLGVFMTLFGDYALESGRLLVCK